ncbi:hypothetical protein U1Q18_039505, partial [Sarracenia purpurea var. burkii]
SCACKISWLRWMVKLMPMHHLIMLRGYLTSRGAGTARQLISDTYLSEFSSFFANSRLRRLFSTEAPKKRSKKNWVL